MKTCIYCAREKPKSEFSLEHIWPDALGGDRLPNFWKTDQVCQKCNRISGLFVDGAFLRTWIGHAERSYGWDQYLSLQTPEYNIVPLNFMGNVKHSPQDVDVDFWTGPCGSHILHFRPAEEGVPFDIYAGGDPKKSKKSKTAGRVYLSLTTRQPFWIQVTLSSLRAHFPHAKRYATNLEVLDGNVGVEKLDWQDPPFPEDLPIIEDIIEKARKHESVHLQSAVKTDFDNRILSKLALGIGIKVFGHDYICSEHAKKLREAMWEADPNKRAKIDIRGAGYGNQIVPEHTRNLIRWPGGWVLLLKSSRNILMFTMVTPSGKTMTIVVSESFTCSPEEREEYENGWVWVAIPTLGYATEAISLPEYLGFQMGNWRVDVLEEIVRKRTPASELPSCWGE